MFPLGGVVRLSVPEPLHAGWGTGGGKITARYLFAEWFDYYPTVKLFFAGKPKPKITGSDHAIWRRIRLIPFRVTIPPDARDKDLLDRLCFELPGILRWAVDGCMMWRAEGLEPPNSVKQATNEYRSEMDFIGDFIRERCDTLDPQARAPFSELYQEFAAWAKLVDSTQNISQKDFANGLNERGFSSGRNSTGRFRCGIRLK